MPKHRPERSYKTKAELLERKIVANYSSESIIKRILHAPRIVRIIIVAVVGILFTSLVFPLVDSIYINYFFSESTTILPSFISTGFGIAIYGVGWWLLVGTRGTELQERPIILWYIIGSVIIFALVIILILNGYSTALLPE